MDWGPFLVCPPEVRPEPPRSLLAPGGVGDRLRTAAFAEIQARQAFLWAADALEDAPTACREEWRRLSQAEDKHLNWLLRRMGELKVDVRERPVSQRLWLSLVSRANASEFAHFMAAAEQRGRDAGLTFQKALAGSDPVTAEMFGKIADEELTHIALARRYF